MAESLRKGIDRKGMSLRDFAHQYLEWAKQQKPASAQAEEWRLNRMVDHLEGQGIKTLEDLTPYHIEQLRTWLKSRVITIGKGEKKEEKDLGCSRSNTVKWMFDCPGQPNAL